MTHQREISRTAAAMLVTARAVGECVRSASWFLGLKLLVRDMCWIELVEIDDLDEAINREIDHRV